MKVLSVFPQWAVVLLLCMAVTAEVVSAPNLAGQSKAKTPERKLHNSIPRKDRRKLNEDSVAMINFESNSEEERMQNYRRITYDLKVYEDEYTNCITEIPSALYSDDSVDACTGRDMVKVGLDIKYVTMRTMSKMDSKIKQLFVERCFQPHIHDEIILAGCDVMERDALTLMWTGLNFYQLIEANKQKYLYEYSRVPYNLYEEILAELTNFGGEFFELINEIDNHKEVTILRLKTLIADRWKLVREDRESAGIVTPKIVHRFEIEEFEHPHYPPFQVKNQHESQFNTEGGFGVNRRLDNRLTAEQQENRHSSRRIFNGSSGYSGLHAKISENRPFAQSRFPKNHALRLSLVGRLSPSDREQSRVPFKNIHTKHYSSG